MNLLNLNAELDYQTVPKPTIYASSMAGCCGSLIYASSIGTAQDFLSLI